jgi:outer membrane usher protein
MLARRTGYLLGLALACLSSVKPALAQGKDDLFKQVFGNKQKIQRRIEAELEVDSYARDAVPITIKGNRLLEVDLIVLGERLADLLDESTAHCLESVDSSQSVEGAGECGIALHYDPASLKLEAVVPADHRREQKIAVRSHHQRRVPTTREAQLSGYLNASASARRQEGSAQRLSSVAVGLDGAVRWLGSTLEFDGLCSSGSCTPGLRSLVVDQPRALRRWRFGDLPDANAGGLAIPRIRGVSVGTAFELAPNQSYTPDLDSPLELNTPATVEVLVNGRQVQRMQLPAGRYSLRDFPLAFGPNNVELRITDAAGRQDVRRLEAFVDLSLLDAGLSRYGVALGKPVVAIDDDGMPVRPTMMTANYAYGLGPRTTVNAAATSIPSLHRHATELGLTRATRGWLIGVDLACSYGQAQGCSANMRFRRALDPARSSPGWRWEGELSARQAHYAEPIGFGTGSESASVLIRAARSLGEASNLSLGLRGAWNEFEGASAVFSAQVGGRLGRGFTFHLGVERDVGPDSPHDTRVAASVSMLFDHARQSIRVDAESADALRSARWQLNRGGMHGGYNATLGATRSDLGSNEDVAASYRNERIGADFTLSRVRPNTGFSVEETRVTIRSGIVYADGHVGLTERVLGGFGIVVPVDSAAAGAVYVNPVDDDYLASSLGPGPAVVPGLRAYEARPLVLSLPDLAANHDPGELFPVVKPGYKGGVIIPAGGAASIGLQVRIFDAQGLPVEMVSGRLLPADGGAALPVFAGRGGRLRASGLTAGHWILELDVKPARRHSLTIPADAQGVIDLGDLKP